MIINRYSCCVSIFPSLNLPSLHAATIGPMRYTHGPIPPDAHPDYSLQFFYIKVKDLKAGLNWPLHVYGCVATRDSVDEKRNFLFKRTRDNFQTLTQKVRLLTIYHQTICVCLICLNFILLLPARTIQLLTSPRGVYVAPPLAALAYV
jgi:hypothetical protein